MISVVSGMAMSKNERWGRLQLKSVQCFQAGGMVEWCMIWASGAVCKATLQHSPLQSIQHSVHDIMNLSWLRQILKSIKESAPLTPHTVLTACRKLLCR